MPPITPRLDLNGKMVEKAKRAMRLRMQEEANAGQQREATKKDLENIRFSETLATAAQEYTEKIISLLNQAGFRKAPPLTPSEKRPRRVDLDTWDELGRVAEGQGLPRMMLIRGLLNLLADEYDEHKAKMAAKAKKPRKAGSSSAKRRSGRKSSEK
jgi:hypothetical protein